MAPTIKEVAEMAGVSITTVSFVLNDKHPQVDGLSEATKQRVRACAAALGYRRNPAAASLRSGKSLWIGVVIQPVREEKEAQAWAPYELTLISGIENALLGLGYYPVLGSKSTTGDVTGLDTLAYSGVAGLIYRRPLRQEVERLEELRQEGIPSIAVFPARREDLYPYSIDLDNVAAGRLGAQLLYRAGSKRPALIVSGFFGHIEEDRVAGFTQGVQELFGYKPMVCDTAGTRDEAARVRILEDFFRRNKPDGVLATEAWGAHLATFAAENAGLKVPQDLVMIGFDCYSFRSAQNMVVSAITTSWWQAGRVAAQSIVDIVRNGTVWTEPKKLEPRFIPGDTTPPELCEEGKSGW
ncbi:MAG: LacI family DNA-binding transcriptional regulator [Armatimonadota bacterium]|nr:LacI family DNA-binding transcriptional regulator [Armatimonadota bacterium]